MGKRDLQSVVYCKSKSINTIEMMIALIHQSFKTDESYIEQLRIYPNYTLLHIHLNLLDKRS